MNHHFRSYSEQQQQPLQPHQQPSHLMNSMNNNNNNNNPVDLPNRDSLSGIIRIHSDSQQSLDRLFNPPNTQSTVPLRNRNLPASFFNPSWQTNKDEESPLGERRQQNNTTNSLHNRSTSFDHRRNNLAGQQHGNVHMRTQSTLAPMTGLMGGVVPESSGNIIAGLTNEHSSDGPRPTPGTNQRQPQQQPPPPQVQAQPTITTPVDPSQNAQQIQPLPQQRNNHYRNFSSPAFMNNATTQANLFYPPTHNAPLNTQGVDGKPHAQTLYYNMETITPQQTDATMTNEPTYSQPQAPTSYQPTVPHDYYSSGSASDLPATAAAQQLGNCAHQAPTYFASSESIQQQFHITHSQPYIPYNPTHSTSSSLLNPPSQTASSSSSNENNSLLCIPTPAVHSRSCSFDDRPSHPVAHVRSQSTLAGMANSTGFSQSIFNNGYSRPVIVGGTKIEPSQTVNGPHNQLGLSPITDQGGVFDEWNEISM